MLAAMIPAAAASASTTLVEMSWCSAHLGNSHCRSLDHLLFCRASLPEHYYRSSSRLTHLSKLLELLSPVGLRFQKVSAGKQPSRMWTEGEGDEVTGQDEKLKVNRQ
ncbi:hypothetical protein Tco_0242583 [Tanacetum coccineum]